MQSIIGNYTVSFAMLLITRALTRRLRARRRLYQLGVVAFTFASLGCYLAPSVPALIGFRGSVFFLPDEVPHQIAEVIAAALAQAA